jgi:hypothetical protein
MEPLVVGDDILDIGSRKAVDRYCGNKAQLGLSQDLLMGRPGAFDVPNVKDVRSIEMTREVLCDTS